MNDNMKQTNPKDILGSKKIPLDLVPGTAIAEMATAFLEGGLKYGKFNWRVEGVRASIYIAAMRRHIAKYADGEDEDRDTNVKHLASAMACCAIIVDAEANGKLVDDRPPAGGTSLYIDGLADKVSHLRAMFDGMGPKHNIITEAVDE